MRWIDPKDELPPQGKKVVWFKAGDMCVVQRYGNLWCPIPYHDSRYATTEAPELWADIEPPEGYTGKVYLQLSGHKKLLDLDEIEAFYPVVYKDFIQANQEMWVKHEGKTNRIRKSKHRGTKS